MSSTMDTTGFSQVGRYGTLSLLKRPTPGVTTTAGGNTYTMSPSQTKVITSFGIDSANLTFGRETTCDVRLYYPEVDGVHCRLINEDGKAFLVVQGKAGALVEGSWVYPHTSSSASASSSSSTTTTEVPRQTITPLTNNSEFEIHNKRFRFTYPPKEVRKVLLATPVANRNRTLRLSMIQSAQVFSPRPSKDPRENLKILQSPLKTSVFNNTFNDNSRRSASPTKQPRAVSPLKFGVRMDDTDTDSDGDSDEDLEGKNDENKGGGEEGNDNNEQEEHIILAHTNHPRVVEEDQDLVILEDIPLHLVLPSPSVYATGGGGRTPVGVRQRGMNAQAPTPGTPTPTPMLVVAQPQAQAPQMQAQPQPQPQPPRTPRRKSIGGNALHRAVLIRSAQRAVWRAEREKEEEEEEMEVLGAVVAPGDADGHDEEEDDEGMGNEHQQEDEDVEMRSASSDGEEEEEESDGEEDKVVTKPLWKKGLERIIPWPFGAKKDDKDDEDAEVEHHEGDNEEDEEEANENIAALPVMPQHHTPIRRALGSFMTPQPRQQHIAQAARRSIFPSTTTSGTATGTQVPSSTTSSTSSTTGTTSHAGPGRYSLGGGEARRVVVQQPWKVKDLVVPPITIGTSATTPLQPLEAMPPPSTPPTPVVRAPRASVSEEERRAIQERRRSAVREVREDSFWKDGAPGMSPAKKQPHGLGMGALGLGRPMSSPRKGDLLSSSSPTKGNSLGYSIAEADVVEEGRSDVPTATIEEPESTVDLLERMRETVEDMKRRRSIATLSTPRTTLLDGDNTGMRGGSAIRGSVKKLDFSHITPAQSKKQQVLEEAEKSAEEAGLASGSKDVDEEEEQSKEPKETEPFSLLRPGARPSLSPKKLDVPAVIVERAPEAEEIEQQEEEDDAKTKGRARGRSRLLRAPKEVHDTTADHQDEEQEQEESSKTRSATKPPSRSKPPSATKPRLRTARSPVPPATVPEDSLAPEPSGSGTKRTRSCTPQPRQEIEEAGGQPEAEVEKVPTRSLPKRTRKGTAEPEEVPVAPKKRGGKKVAEPESQVDEEEVEEEVVEKVKPTPAKRGRKPRAAATPAPIEEAVQEEETPVLPPTATKRSRSKKAKEPAPAAAGEGDEDELDSYEVTQPPPPVANVKKASASKVPARIPTLARGQKRTAGVATPEPPIEEEEESVPLAATRAGRAPRGNSNATTTRTKTPTNATTPAAAAGRTAGAVAKPRGRVKTPASAPAAVATSSTMGDSAEKENTPGAGGSTNDSDEEPVVTKVRVSRKASATTTAAGSGKTARSTTSKTKAKNAVKIEQNDEEEQEVVAGGRARTTRIMRTRTKTG